MDALVSRFFRVDDPQTHDFVYPIPDTFWSRFYEYEWTKAFTDPNDTCLDAASGVVHPLQFYLADHCKSVYACDLDPRVGSRPAIEAMMRDWKIDMFVNQDRYFSNVQRTVCSLTNLPYADAFFDRVDCISTLEHLRDRFNRYHVLQRLTRYLRPFLRSDIFDTLAEFKRVLKTDGMIILTFDYPRINLAYLTRIVDELCLVFCGPVDFQLPPNAVTGSARNLNCFRAVLRKRA